MRFACQDATLLLGLSAILLISCGKAADPSGQTASRGPARPVQVGTVELRVMEQTISAMGTLAPQEASTISTKVSGRIQRLEVDIGSTVRQGELLAQIEPKDYELRLEQSAAALAEARAALGLPLQGESERADPETVSSVKQAKAVLDEASKSLERVRSLTQSRIASTSELDASEAAYKVALTRYEAATEDARARVAALAQRRAEFNIARKALSDASVLAPYAGAIQARPASVGEYVSAGTPIVMLVKTDPLRLRLEVTERESMLVRAGQAVRLAVSGDTNIFTGQIARLSPVLDETNRMLLVEADVPNPGTLRGGLFARTEIVVNARQEGLSVPENALLVFAGIEKVVLVQSGKAVEKSIITGRRGPGWVEVVSGVEAGSQVVLNPTGLRSGQPIIISQTADPSQTSNVGSNLTVDVSIKRGHAKTR